MTLRNEAPLRKYYYPTFKETYEEIGDGKVRVTDSEGRTGVFLWNGPYQEGELTQANLHMLVWTGGPNIPRECNYRWSEVPVAVNRPTGWPAELEETLHYQLGK